jgi:hypothetical protein
MEVKLVTAVSLSVMAKYVLGSDNSIKHVTPKTGFRSCKTE